MRQHGTDEDAVIHKNRVEKSGEVTRREPGTRRREQFFPANEVACPSHSERRCANTERNSDYFRDVSG